MCSNFQVISSPTGPDGSPRRFVIPQFASGRNCRFDVWKSHAISLSDWAPFPCASGLYVIGIIGGLSDGNSWVWLTSPFGDFVTVSDFSDQVGQFIPENYGFPAPGEGFNFMLRRLLTNKVKIAELGDWLAAH